MEEKKPLKQDCGCDSDCCQPKKNSSWKKFVFIAIVLAAGTIVTIKLVSNKPANSQVNTENNNSITPNKTSDTSGVNTCTKISGPQNKTSCCPSEKEEKKSCCPK